MGTQSKFKHIPATAIRLYLDTETMKHAAAFCVTIKGILFLPVNID